MEWVSPACECGVAEGQFHSQGCRWELCPFCAEIDATGCECKYEHLGFQRRENFAEFDYLAESVWQLGLTRRQQVVGRTRCETRGRLPYVYAPQLCGRCGARWPELFMVQDRAWEYYAGPRLRAAMLCESCFTTLRANIDRHNERPRGVPAPEEIARYVVAWRAKDLVTLRELDPEKSRLSAARNTRLP